MSAERTFTGLTGAQADGLACVVCGLDYLRACDSSLSVPVGRSVTGSQAFARSPRRGLVDVICSRWKIEGVGSAQ